MYALIEKTTNAGKKLYYKINSIDGIIVFDDTRARLQIDSDCCVRTPVRPKDKIIDKFVEIE